MDAVFGPFKTVFAQVSGRLRRERTRSGQVETPRISDVIPAMLEAWKAAVAPANVIAGFRRTGIHPYDPHAWKLTSRPELIRRGGLPLVLSTAEQLLTGASTAARSLPHASDLAVHRTPTKRKGEGEGVQKAKKAAPPRLDTGPGLLLTCADTRARITAIEEHRRKVADDKAARKVVREANKAAKEVSQAEKAATGAGGQMRGRKRKAAAPQADLENVEPNTQVRGGLRGSAVLGGTELRLHPLMVPISDAVESSSGGEVSP